MWYAFTQPNESPQKGYQELAKSTQLLTEWLKSLESTTGVPLSRTILMGFSQGGAMTLDVGLYLPINFCAPMLPFLIPMEEREECGMPLDNQMNHPKRVIRS